MAIESPCLGANEGFSFEERQPQVGITWLYCGNCNRMRLTADGKFHLCLLNDDELDIRRALRAGTGDEIDQVAKILRRAVTLKPTGHHRLEGRSTRDRSMYQIGG